MDLFESELQLFQEFVEENTPDVSDYDQRLATFLSEFFEGDANNMTDDQFLRVTDYTQRNGYDYSELPNVTAFFQNSKYDIQDSLQDFPPLETKRIEENIEQNIEDNIEENIEENLDYNHRTSYYYAGNNQTDYSFQSILDKVVYSSLTSFDSGEILQDFGKYVANIVNEEPGFVQSVADDMVSFLENTSEIGNEFSDAYNGVRV